MARILIVEDSAFQRTIIKRILSKAGHDYAEAKSGREALREIDENKPDLIFLDLLMPDIDGFQVLKVMQSKHIRIPVVVITADVQDTTREKCFEYGVKKIVYKPVDEKKIADALAEVLDSQGDAA